MIHTASLIHDDVIDDADTRRGGAAVHKAYSNTVRASPALPSARARARAARHAPACHRF